MQSGSPDSPIAKPPISILACGGGLPLEIAGQLRQGGIEPNIVTIAGMADADYSGYALQSVSIGRIGALLAALRANGARDMLIAGHARRPDLRSLNIDSGFIRHIFTILGLMRGGDDRVLRNIAAFFERNGMTVRSLADLTPELLTPSGVLAGNPATVTKGDAQTGLALIRNLGPFDVGQAVVVEAGRVIAIEGAEGTNGLLARLPARNTRGTNTLARTLVKAAKPDQDLRMDLPTIGTETITRCKEAGVSAIALEAGRSLIVDRTATIKAADQSSIAILGINSPTETNSAANVGIANQLSETRAGIRSHTRVKPSRQDRRDANKGALVLSRLVQRGPVRGAIVARENVLAIDLDEPIEAFIGRSNHLAQWGDKRQKNKRNRTLILTKPEDITPSQTAALIDTKIAGIMLLSAGANPGAFDELVSVANAQSLFLLSLE
jgi:UDP-2,3-diacylglucosamine hydrolase